MSVFSDDHKADVLELIFIILEGKNHRMYGYWIWVIKHCTDLILVTTLPILGIVHLNCGFCHRVHFLFKMVYFVHIASQPFDGAF